MDFTPELLSEALANIYTNDQDLITQSGAYIEEVENTPDGILLFLQIIQTSPNVKIRKAAITNLLTIVNKKWSQIPDEIQEQSRQLINEIIQMKLTFEELSMMADICADLFKAMGYWDQIIKNICIAYQSQNYEYTMLFLSKIFPVIPNQLLESYSNAFLKMAYDAIQTDDQETGINSVKVFVQIAKRNKDVNLVMPAISFLVEELTNSHQYDSVLFSKLWQFVYDILDIENADESLATSFFEVADTYITNENIDVERRQIVLSEFEPAILFVPKDMLLLMISYLFELTLLYIDAEEKLPTVQQFSILDESLLKRSAEVSEFVKTKFIEYFTKGQDESSEVMIQCFILSLSILRSLLQNSPDCMMNENELIKNSLISSISTDNELLQCASLQVIDVLDMQFNESEISNISVELMQQVTNLLISPIKNIRNYASNAFLTLCDMCDTEVDGLLDHLWSLKSQDQIQRDSLANYLLILAKVLSISKNIPDEVQEEILKFIEQVFSLEEEQDEDEGEEDDVLSLKAVSLDVLSSLFEKNASLMPEILPKIVPILTMIFESDQDLVINRAFHFLSNLAKIFRGEILSFVSDFYEIILSIFSQHCNDRSFYLPSIEAASMIIKYCGDQTLLEPTVEEISHIFSDSDLNTLTDVCTYLGLISKALADYKTEVIQSIFTALVQIVKEQNDNNLLYEALEALSKIFKRCRQNNLEFYDQTCENLINCIFNGEIKYLNGNPENLLTLQFDMSSYLLELVEVFLRVEPPNANEIFEVLFKWMTNADEDVASYIIGVVTESMKRIDVNTELLTSIIDYLASIAEMASAVRLRHNIAYFLSNFLEKYNDQFEVVSHFLPYLDKWWAEGKDKEIGYQRCLSNIAVLYLRLFVSGAQVQVESVDKAISAFPPADATETENMAVLILQIFMANQQDQEFIHAILNTTCLALADFLTQPATGINMLKISPETLENIQGLFKSILADNENMKAELNQIYQSNSEKINNLSQYI